MQHTVSKKFVNEQKLRLEQEKEKIVQQIEQLKIEDPFSDPDHASDNAAVDTDVREQVGHDTIEAQIKDLEKRKEDIAIVLKRIGKGKYGLCEKCNNPILVARLNLVPEARFCMDCEKKIHIS